MRKITGPLRRASAVSGAEVDDLAAEVCCEPLRDQRAVAGLRVALDAEEGRSRPVGIGSRIGARSTRSRISAG